MSKDDEYAVDYMVEDEDGRLVEIVLKSGERIYNAPSEPERTEAPYEKEEQRCRFLTLRRTGAASAESW